MSKTIVGMLALAGLAGAANAQTFLSTTDIGHYQFDRLTGGLIRQVDDNAFDPRVTGDRYRNFSAPPSSLQAVYSHGIGTQNGDDISMVAPGAGKLADMGFSIANNNGAGQRLALVNGTIRFYDSSLAFLGGFTYTADLAAILGGGGLDGGFSVRLSFGAGALTGLNLFIPTAAYVTQSFDSATVTGGGSTANLGQQVRNPVAIGSSTNNFIFQNNIIAGPIGNFPANLSYFINTDNVPTPGALALLGVGGLLASRRRR